MLRWTRRLLVAGTLLALLLALAVWLALRGSLASLDGELPLSGLSAPVTVQRDALGVVSIEAANQHDALRALGHVHAQERYFEMDLMRRAGAGELAALLGPALVATDRELRPHRLRARVEARIDAITAGRETLVQAYVDGINAGVSGLRVRPWPYLLLRQQPRAWQPADSALVGYAMYFDLQAGMLSGELARLRLQSVLPEPLYTLLNHPGSSWDASLDGDVFGDVVLPGPDQLDLRQDSDSRQPGDQSSHAEPDTPGSNNFAVAGTLTADGRAILADDMHLGLRAPNIWFRVRLRYPDPRAPDGQIDVSGFSLPGLPAIVVGSNGHIAWGFTNAYVDTADWALIEQDAPTRQIDEILDVRGGEAQTLIVEETDWGPVMDRDQQGRGWALRWVAHLPGSLNLELMDFAHAADLEQADRIADRSSLSVQNLLLADRQGRIGWRLLGALPQRGPGCRGDALNVTSAPTSTAGASNETEAASTICAPWPITSADVPRRFDPADGRLWTANARVVDGDDLVRVGDGGYDLGARARQIRDGLRARARFTEADLLAIQLDDEAVFLQRWWQLLRQVTEASDDPALQRLEAAGRAWDGRASVDSVSYRMARSFRGLVLDSVRDGLLASAREKLGEDYVNPRQPQFENLLWPLVTEKPAHLLPSGHADWDGLLADAARRLEADLSAQGPLATLTWGERNATSICHPMARALPGFARGVLCYPRAVQPGDSHVPRVAAPSFGASQRMVVSPGHESDGIVHMPGGQSGHPLSPFWQSGYEDWLHGRATPFLPGPTQHRLVLTPGG